MNADLGLESSAPTELVGSDRSQWWRKTLVLWITSVMIYAEASNLSGEWITRAGGLYTLIEKAGERISIVPGGLSKPSGRGWLERRSDETLRGEVVLDTCVFNLSLIESADGRFLVGSVRIDPGASSQCRKMLPKKMKKAGVIPFVLERRH